MPNSLNFVPRCPLAAHFFLHVPCAKRASCHAQSGFCELSYGRAVANSCLFVWRWNPAHPRSVDSQKTRRLDILSSQKNLSIFRDCGALKLSPPHPPVTPDTSHSVPHVRVAHTQDTMAASVSVLRVVAPVARLAVRKGSAARCAAVAKVRLRFDLIARVTLSYTPRASLSPRSSHRERSFVPCFSAREPRMRHANPNVTSSRTLHAPKS